MCGFMMLCMTISSVFAMGERSAMGLYDVLSFLFLLGLRMGMILAVFQGCGIVLVFSALLYRRVSGDWIMIGVVGRFLMYLVIFRWSELVLRVMGFVPYIFY